MRLSKKDGFTIVELLIVIVVIAILAAITIVSYNGITNRAKAAATASLVSQINGKLLVYAVANDDAYPNSLADIGISDSDGKSYQYSVNNSTTPPGFCITATNGGVSAFTSTNFTYTSGSTQTINQTDPKPGACPGHVAGGQVALRNEARNPRGTSVGGADWLTRYSQTRTHISGASDGPLPGLDTYARFTQGAAASGGGRGIDHRSNIDTPNASITQLWPVTAGEPMNLSIYTRASVSNSSLVIRYRIHDGAGAWLTGANASSCPFMAYTANTWVRITCVFTPTVTGYLAATVRYEASVSWPTGATIDATGLMFSNGSSVPAYADGNSAGWVWTGDANNSISTGPAL